MTADTPAPINAERLRLAQLRLEDAEAVFAYRSQPDVARYQGWRPSSVDEVTEFIRKNATVGLGERDTWYQLAIRLQHEDTLIGDIGLHFTSNKDEAEVGVTVSPNHQGQGFGKEAVTAALGYLFGPMAQHRVFGSVDPCNIASVRLLAAVGMRREAHFRQSLWFDGAWVDDVIFAMLRSEWEK